MAITLSDEATKQCRASMIYNQAIADAQAYFQGRVVDLEGVCYQREFTYWAPRAAGRPGPARGPGSGPTGA